MEGSEEKFSPEPVDNFEKQIEEIERESSLLNIKEIKEFKKNAAWFFKFCLEVLDEKPEAESYPAFFLPSLSGLLIFLSFATVVFQKMVAAFYASAWKSTMAGFLLSLAAIFGFMLGLRICSTIFKGSRNVQDIAIVTGIFTVPLSIGIFLAWLVSYGTFIAGILVLFIAHSTAIVALYSVLPKTMLLKGRSRFLTVLGAIGFSVLASSVLLRLIV